MDRVARPQWTSERAQKGDPFPPLLLFFLLLPETNIPRNRSVFHSPYHSVSESSSAAIAKSSTVALPQPTCTFRALVQPLILSCPLANAETEPNGFNHSEQYVCRIRPP